MDKDFERLIDEAKKIAIKREVMEEVHIKLDKVVPFDFDSEITIN